MPSADPKQPTVPRCEMLLVHSSVRSFLPRVPSLLLPLDTFRCRALPTRVPSLFAASPGPSTRHESSHAPATFRPQAFSASRRLTPAPTSRACSIPQPRPGFLPSRGFSLRAATFPRREELPPCRCPLCAHYPKAAATLGILDFEALFHTKKRFSGSVINLPFVRSPRRVPPPPGLAHPRFGPRLPVVIRS
jgi:hypothetical protein